jgi:putative Holliday junction resolvase
LSIVVVKYLPELILKRNWGSNERLLVVGKPSNSKDKTELLASINKFANRLSHRFNLPVNFINEDYTSSLASGQLNEQNILGRKQGEKLDQLAACAILETYFNNCIK